MNTSWSGDEDALMSLLGTRSLTVAFAVTAALAALPAGASAQQSACSPDAQYHRARGELRHPRDDQGARQQDRDRRQERSQRAVEQLGVGSEEDEAADGEGRHHGQQGRHERRSPGELDQSQDQHGAEHGRGDVRPGRLQDEREPGTHRQQARRGRPARHPRRGGEDRLELGDRGIGAQAVEDPSGDATDPGRLVEAQGRPDRLEARGAVGAQGHEEPRRRRGAADVGLAQGSAEAAQLGLDLVHGAPAGERGRPEEQQAAAGGGGRRHRGGVLRHTARMPQLAQIAPGESSFDPRLLSVLEESGVEKDDFEDLDWFSLLPFFALAGASIETEAHAHGDHAHFVAVRIVLPDELCDHFYTVLPEMLKQLA